MISPMTTSPSASAEPTGASREFCLRGLAEGTAPSMNHQLPAPPAAAQHPVTDTYAVAGSQPVQVVDPYRWLEEAHSPETRSFINAENAYTARYFDQAT